MLLHALQFATYSAETSSPARLSLHVPLVTSQNKVVTQFRDPIILTHLQSAESCDHSKDIRGDFHRKHQYKYPSSVQVILPKHG